jgi:hypothetical protein
LTAQSIGSTSGQQQSSTEHPTTDMPRLNEVEQIEILPAVSTSRPIAQ